MYTTTTTDAGRLFRSALALLAAWISSGNANAAALCDKTAMDSGMQASFHMHGGKRVLIIAGEFNEGAATRVQRHVRNTRAYKEIWLCSPGGLVSEGKALGRAFASAKATVRVPNGFSCISACTIAFLGGFARIVEPQSKYVVHASSRYNSLDFLKQPAVLDCSRKAIQRACGLLLNEFSSGDTKCQSPEHIFAEDRQCQIFGPDTDEKIAVRYKALVKLPKLAFLALPLATEVTRSEAEHSIDLLRYYQEMLLAGRSDVGRSTYAQLKSDFVPLGVYDPANGGQDARTFEDDYALLNASQYVDRFAIWQSLLTDSELTAKRQLVAYIRQRGLTFGPASADALRIFEAMVVCQIQTSCRLSQDEAAALGIHNVLDAS